MGLIRLISEPESTVWVANVPPTRLPMDLTQLLIGTAQPGRTFIQRLIIFLLINKLTLVCKNVSHC